MSNDRTSDPPRISRRAFLGGLATAGAGMALPVGAPAAREAPGAAVPEAAARRVVLAINGVKHELMLEPRVTLLDALREVLGMTGTKKGCDRGQCGSCTVIADGRRINACLTLAVMQEGAQITTVEGLARDASTLIPLQQAFVEHDAFQCGYCTPGQLCSAIATLEEMRAGMPSAVTRDVRRVAVADSSAEEIRERMSGNICRCGAYPNIVAAIQAAAAPRKPSRKS